MSADRRSVADMFFLPAWLIGRPTDTGGHNHPRRPADGLVKAGVSPHPDGTPSREGWVESRTGAVAWAKLASPRFPSPLIKPDVRISRIRLSDWLHLEADGRAPTWTWRSRSTPRSPNTTPSG